MRLWNHIKVRHYKRNQVMMTEGDQVSNISIIANGLFQISKNVYKEKLQNYEHDLLTKNTKTTQRYTTNF